MTQLSPLEEALFRTWAAAQGVDNYDDPNNAFDHRGLYKQTNGLVQPLGVVSRLAQQHNSMMDQQGQEGGDTTYPDPYMAQAEMQGNMLKYQGDMRKDQLKIQMEEKKLQHQSQEKEKDRQHKLMLEQLKMQQKQQADMMNAQMRAQEAQANRQARAEEAEKMRQAGVQDSIMQEGFARSRPQPEPSMSQGQPQMGQQAPKMAPEQPQGSGLEQTLLQRAMPSGGL